MKTISIEKQKNLAILAELVQIGNKYIRIMDIEDGVYSSADLCKNPVYLEQIYLGQMEDVTSVTVGTFSCTFARCMVFELVNRFERLCGISGNKRHKFIKQSTDEAAYGISWHFNMAIPA